jgi:hypothetical protein
VIVAEISPSKLQELLAKLDEVCRQARELQRTVRQTLADSRRRDRADLSGQPERRAKPRSK